MKPIGYVIRARGVSGYLAQIKPLRFVVEVNHAITLCSEQAAKRVAGDLNLSAERANDRLAFFAAPVYAPNRSDFAAQSLE